MVSIGSHWARMIQHPPAHHPSTGCLTPVSIGSHWARVIHPPAHHPSTGCLNLNLSCARSISCQLGNNCHRAQNSQINKFLNLPGPPPPLLQSTPQGMGSDWKNFPNTARTDRQTPLLL
jgi:hypothetical protein